MSPLNVCDDIWPSELMQTVLNSLEDCSDVIRFCISSQACRQTCVRIFSFPADQEADMSKRLLWTCVTEKINKLFLEPPPIGWYWWKSRIFNPQDDDLPGRLIEDTDLLPLLHALVARYNPEKKNYCVIKRANHDELDPLAGIVQPHDYFRLDGSQWNASERKHELTATLSTYNTQKRKQLMVAVKQGDDELLDLVRLAFELRQVKAIRPPFRMNRFTAVDFTLPEITSQRVDRRLRFQQTHLNQKRWLLETFPFLKVHDDDDDGEAGDDTGQLESMLTDKTQSYDSVVNRMILSQRRNNNDQ